MNNDLIHYVESEILPTAGIVEENSEPISTLPAMREWIEANLRVTMPITVKNLSDYLFLDNDGIIQKKRSLYLNQLDFYCLDAELNGDEHVNPHKEILNVTVIPVADIEQGEFYYCSDDEWQILKVE